MKHAPGSAARGFSFVLEAPAGVLELRALHHPGYGAIRADWSAPDVRRRIAGGRRQPLARAAGLRKAPALRVLDATAGLGRDGFTLAALGARVTLVERHPSIAALLTDARRRALLIPDLAEGAARTEIVEANARELMHPDWDVVYLDPMYPERGAALAKKELQLLRELTGGDADADSLLEPALDAACQRVVVKRPAKAPPLARRAPSFSLGGSQARYDVYLSG
jgi:16S rRNA (guanine1516-N2)-methyltransferase